jgi:hypothetical protein
MYNRFLAPYLKNINDYQKLARATAFQYSTKLTGSRLVRKILFYYEQKEFVYWVMLREFAINKYEELLPKVESHEYYKKLVEWGPEIYDILFGFYERTVKSFEEKGYISKA